MILEIILFFVFGLFVGSFLNVLIYRIPKDEGFLAGRSYCDNCKKNLNWYDLIPLLSYIALKGKCRFCKNKISRQIPLVELLTGIFFVLALLKYPLLDISFIFYILVICSFLVIFFTDLGKGIIPNKILYPTFVIILIYVFSNQNLINHLISSFASFIFFFLIYFLSKGKGMGFGDVKFAAVLGLLLGFPLVITCFYIGFLTGGIVGLILVIWRKKRFKKDTIPFGPFLSLAGLISIFLGDLLVSRLLSFLQL